MTSSYSPPGVQDRIELDNDEKSYSRAFIVGRAGFKCAD